MKTINLRWIYPHYRHDEFVEVSDEVWEAMRQAQREMNNYERRKVYHRAWYSLDAGLTNDPFSGYQVKGIVSLIPAGGGQRTSCDRRGHAGSL